jgi:hypothetical protein
MAHLGAPPQQLALAAETALAAWAQQLGAAAASSSSSSLAAAATAAVEGGSARDAGAAAAGGTWQLRAEHVARGLRAVLEEPDAVLVSRVGK